MPMQQLLAVLTCIAATLHLAFDRWVTMRLMRQTDSKREALLQLNLLIV